MGVRAGVATAVVVAAWGLGCLDWRLLLGLVYVLELDPEVTALGLDPWAAVWWSTRVPGLPRENP